MKKGIKIITIFFAALIVFACEKDKAYNGFDESTPEGVYPYIKGTPTSILFYFNEPASSYKTAMGLSGPTKAVKMDTYVVVSSVETLVKSTDLPSDTFEVTLQEVADALGQPLTDFTPGLQVVLRNKIIDADNKVWSGANTSHISGGLLGGTPYGNLLNDLSVFVTCPFNADDAVGTYTIVQDDWADVTPGGTLDVTKVDATNITVVGYPSTFGNNHHDMVVTVDPATGVATVTKQLSGGYGAGDTEFTAGSGLVFSCVGYIKVTLNFTYNGGAYNGYTLILSK